MFCWSVNRSIFINGIVFSCHLSRNDISYYDSWQNSGLLKMKPLIGKRKILMTNDYWMVRNDIKISFSQKSAKERHWNYSDSRFGHVKLAPVLTHFKWIARSQESQWMELFWFNFFGIYSLQSVQKATSSSSKEAFHNSPSALIDKMAVYDLLIECLCKIPFEC